MKECQVPALIQKEVVEKNQQLVDQQPESHDQEEKVRIILVTEKEELLDLKKDVLLKENQDRDVPLQEERV